MLSSLLASLSSARKAVVAAIGVVIMVTSNSLFTSVEGFLPGPWQVTLNSVVAFLTVALTWLVPNKSASVPSAN